MMRTIKIMTSTVALMLSLSASAAVKCTLQNYVATYNVMASGRFVGIVVQKLAQKSGNYNFNSITKTKVLFFHDVLHESSSGKLTKMGFQPLAYHLGDQKKGSVERLQFNWRAQQVNSLLKGQQEFMKISLGQQDNLSFQLQLRYDLLTSQPNYKYRVVNNNQLQMKTFKVISEHAKLRTKLGVLDTIQLESNVGPKGVQLMYWFAPKYNDVLAQSVTIVNGNPKATATLTGYHGSDCA